MLYLKRSEKSFTGNNTGVTVYRSGGGAVELQGWCGVQIWSEDIWDFTSEI